MAVSILNPRLPAGLSCFILFANAPLMSRGNFHVLPIFGDSAPGHIDAFGLETCGDLFVSERMSRVFFVDHLLDLALQQQQGGLAARGSLYRFGEEVA